MPVQIPSPAEMWLIKNLPTIKALLAAIVAGIILLVAACLRSETLKEKGGQKQVSFSRRLAGLLIEEAGVFFSQSFVVKNKKP